MDTAAGLSFRYSLHTVRAIFVLQPGIGTAPLYHEADLLVTAVVARVRFHHFSLPAVIFCVAGIHSEQIACKYLGLISARSTSYFDDDVFVIIWIFRKE